MFGGFDGEFYNDLNVLSLHQDVKCTQVSESSKDTDYLSLVNNAVDHDVEFKISNESESTVVFAHRSLILFRLIEREKASGAKGSMTKLVETCPEFLRRVYNCKGVEVF